MTDDDVHADRYLIADEVLAAAGFSWYEVSNWATSDGRPLPAQRAVLARRRLVGRGPRRAQPRRRGALVEREAPGRLRAGAGRGPVARAPGANCSPAEDRRVERILLELRLADGCPLALLAPGGRRGRGPRR